MPQFPQSHLDHARERVTASAGDAVVHGGTIRIVRMVSCEWRYGDEGEPERAWIAYDLGEGLHKVPATEVTLHACDPEGPPAAGDQVTAMARMGRNAPLVPMAGTIASSTAERAVILFDHGVGSGYDLVGEAVRVTRRATADDAADAMRRCAIWNRASRDEQDYPKSRPAGYHKLKTSFDQRHVAKDLGAMWAPRFKCWYALPAARMSVYDKLGIAYQTQGRGNYGDDE